MPTGSNVVTILGSPRKQGNSALLAKYAAEGAKEAGATVHTFFVHDMEIQFCQGCFKCRTATADNCMIQDDMHQMYPILRQASAVIFACPIYWANVSAQMKTVLDRCFALGGPEGHDLERKRYGIILTYANPDPFKSGTMNAIRTFQDNFDTGIMDIICARAKEAAIEKDLESLYRAKKLGYKLGAL